MYYFNISTFKIESLVLRLQQYIHKEMAGIYSIIFCLGKRNGPSLPHMICIRVSSRESPGSTPRLGRGKGSWLQAYNGRAADGHLLTTCPEVWLTSHCQALSERNLGAVEGGDMVWSSHFFMQLKNLGLLCQRLLERGQRRTRHHSFFSISFPRGTNFKADGESQPLRTFFLAPNAICHRRKPCLALSTFSVLVLTVPSAMNATQLDFLGLRLWQGNLGAGSSGRTPVDRCGQRC